MTRSGVSRCSLPSRWERKVTPSSSMRRSRARLHTWKPPESVKIGPCQPMKRCRPPCAATTSGPGRSSRWYVLARIIVAPTLLRSSGLTDLTVACVPTGMKQGVCTAPCGVSSRPVRACPLCASMVNVRGAVDARVCYRWISSQCVIRWPPPWPAPVGTGEGVLADHLRRSALECARRAS